MLALAAQLGINHSAIAQNYDVTISGNHDLPITLPTPPTTGGAMLIDATANIYVPWTNIGLGAVIHGASNDIGWTITNQGIITNHPLNRIFHLENTGANALINAGTINIDRTSIGYSLILANTVGSSIGGTLEINNLPTGIINCFGLSTSDPCVSSVVPATINNEGTIITESGAGVVQGFAYGSSYSPMVMSSSITNSGLIQAPDTAVQLDQPTDLAVVHNKSGGRLVGGLALNSWNDGFAQAGIWVLNGKNTLIQNDAGATISGGFGISSLDQRGTLGKIDVINAGTITGQRLAAIQLANGGTITNQTGGLINGQIGILGGFNWQMPTAVVSNPTVIFNAGTITGTGGVAIEIDGQGQPSTLTLQTGSVLNGIVVGGAGRDELVLTGTGSESLTGVINTYIGYSQPSPHSYYNATPFSTDMKFNNFDVLTMNGDNWFLHNAGIFKDSIQVNAGTLQLTGHTGAPITHVAAGGALVLGAIDNDDSLLITKTLTIDAGATAGGYGYISYASPVGLPGAGPNKVINNGTLAVGAAMAVLGNGPTGSLTIEGTIDNGGTILMGRAGSTGNQLVTQSYNGRNGTIVFNTQLGDDNSATDRLIIRGDGYSTPGTATGSTNVQVVNAGGPGALTAGNGILLIDAQNGATTEATAFRQAGRIAAGAYEYTLYRGSRDAAAPESWYLRSERAPDPGPNPPLPPPEPIPDYRQEVSLYTALPSIAATYGQTMLGTLHQRRGDEGNPGTLGSNASWTRMLASHTHNGGGSDGIYGSGPRYNTDTWAVQSGFDLYRGQDSSGGRDLAGVYLAVGTASADVWHYTGARAGQDTLMGYTAGAYWTHFGATGWYVDAVAQATYYDVKAEGNGSGAQSLTTNGTGFATSLEAGYPIHLDGRAWSIEPQAQLIAQWLDLDAASDAVSRVSFSDGTALTGRVGVRLARNWTYASGTEQRNVNLWFRPNVWHEFKGDPRTTVAGLDGQNAVGFHSDLGGTWAEFNMGVNADLNRRASLYLNASYSRGLSSNDRDGYDGQAGIKVVW